MITENGADAIEPMSADLEDLLASERTRPDPPAATGRRVGARLARTHGWRGVGGGPNPGGGRFASRAFAPAIAGLIALASLTGVVALRRPSASAPAPSSTATAHHESEASGAAASSRARSFARLRLVSGSAAVDPSKENGSFEGRVRSSATGRPIGRAQIVFSREGQTFSTLSRDDGTFVFDAPEPGRYALAHASAEGHIDFAPVWGESGVELVARPGTRLEGAAIDLAPAIEYVGVVRTPSHEPVAGATVRFASPPMGRADHAVTDAKGEFRLVLDADDALIATHPDFGPGRAIVRLGERSTHRIALQLAVKGDAPRGLVDSTSNARPEGAGTLRGKVQSASNGSPVAAFSIIVWSRIGSMQRETAAVGSFFDASGEYELRGLSPGDFAVTAVAEGFAPSSEASVTIGGQGKADVARDFVLERGARVHGTVVDDATKRAIAGAQVSLEGALGAELAPVRFTAATVTNDAGHFELTGLSAGLRSIMVSEPRHHGRILSSLDAGASGDLEPVLIELARAKDGEEPRLELTGIGAALTSREDVLLVDKVLDTGGASEAGLRPGDAILTIDGTRASELGFDQSVQRMRGPEGSTVVLTLQRAGGEAIIELRVPRRRVRVR